jgi:hypothetical protein
MIVRIWIAATQIGLFVLAMFFIAWSATTIEQKAAERKITMMRTERLRELQTSFNFAASGFTITTSAFLLTCVLMISS